MFFLRCVTESIMLFNMFWRIETPGLEISYMPRSSFAMNSPNDLELEDQQWIYWTVWWSGIGAKSLAIFYGHLNNHSMLIEITDKTMNMYRKQTMDNISIVNYISTNQHCGCVNIDSIWMTLSNARIWNEVWRVMNWIYCSIRYLFAIKFHSMFRNMMKMMSLIYFPQIHKG